jgi:hypothetical protein
MIELNTARGPIQVDPDALVYLTYEACTARTLLPGEVGRVWVDGVSVPVWRDKVKDST